MSRALLDGFAVVGRACLWPLAIGLVLCSTVQCSVELASSTCNELVSCPSGQECVAGVCRDRADGGVDGGSDQFEVIEGCENCDQRTHQCVSMVIEELTCQSLEPLCIPRTHLLEVPNSSRINPAREPYRVRLRLLPPTHFVMGCDPESDPSCQPQEQPQHQVELGAYYMMESEVNVGQFIACIDQGTCSADNYQQQQVGCALMRNPDDERLQLSMNCVSRRGAHQFCDFLGGRLPTEAEWERAARGGCGRYDNNPEVCILAASGMRHNQLYPWGDEAPVCGRFCWSPDLGLCAYVHVLPCQTLQYEYDKSPDQILDMAGNLSEWVSDDYRRDYLANLHSPPVQCPYWRDSDDVAVGCTRGGNYRSSRDEEVRVSTRQRRPLDGWLAGQASRLVGFRCVFELSDLR